MDAPIAGETAVSVTWVGHSTVLIEIDGLRILTDPVLTARVAHLRRRTPVTHIGPVDVVLVSHAHMDHLHGRSLRSVAGGCDLFVPAGAEPLVTGAGARRTTTVVAGDTLVLDRWPDVRIDVVRANHKTGRGPHSRVRAEPVGYVVRIGTRSVYFPGDTDLFDGMRTIGPVDLALLPIWGWGSTLGEQHLDPARAATATGWIDPAVVVPIHWGTYSPTRLGVGPPRWLPTPLADFRAELERAGLSERLRALVPGESLTLG